MIAWQIAYLHVRSRSIISISLGTCVTYHEMIACRFFFLQIFCIDNVCLETVQPEFDTILCLSTTKVNYNIKVYIHFKKHFSRHGFDLGTRSH